MADKENKKVLVVDDMPLIRDIMAKALSDYTVFFASNGEEALEQALKEKPHVVLLDINMPKMDGVEFLKRIKEEDEDIEVIVISAHGTNEMYEKIMALGVDTFIIKPFRVTEVQAKVAHLFK